MGTTSYWTSSPQCQQYRESTSVLENQPAGTFVLQVHAVDADEGSNGKVTYGFMHKDSTVPAFSIHPDTGTETLKNVFYFISLGSYIKNTFFFLKEEMRKEKKSTVGYINTNISSQKKKKKNWKCSLIFHSLFSHSHLFLKKNN